VADDAGRALDEYLVSLSQSGSVEALDGLARRWTPRLLRYAARVLGSSADSSDVARDIVQDTWVGVIRGLRGLQDTRQFPAWIYGIATRKCVDEIRTRTRRRQFDAAVASESPAAANPDVEQHIDLAGAIRALPPIHRAAVSILAAGTPVTCAARCGVHADTDARTASNPVVCASR